MMLKRFYNTGEPMEQTNVTYRIISNPTKSDIESLVDNPCIIHKAIMGDHMTIGVIQPSDTLLWNLVGTPVDRDTFWNECLPQILTADVKPYYNRGTPMVSVVFLINELPEVLKYCGAIWLNDTFTGEACFLFDNEFGSYGYGLNRTCFYLEAEKQY